MLERFQQFSQLQDYTALANKVLLAIGVFGVVQAWSDFLYIGGLLALVAAFILEVFLRLARGQSWSMIAEASVNLLLLVGVASVVQWWRPDLYEAGLGILLISLSAYLPAQLYNNNDFASALERLSTLLLAIGFFGMFQWWQPNDLYWLGRFLVVVGFGITIFAMLVAKTELYKIVEQSSLLLLIAGIYGVFQWRRLDDYEAGVWLLQIGFVGYIVGLLMSRLAIVATLERTLIILIILGMLGMFQSWNIEHYENGFYLLSLSVLGFIIVSHIPQRESIG